MKLPERVKRLNAQTRWMIIAIVLLLIMIATRWGYISRTAGTAFKERFDTAAGQHDLADTTSAGGAEPK